MTTSVARGAVELDRVAKRFGEVVAVRSVSLSVSGGEFLSLLGGSGCGKTTTLRMLAGFEIPDEGTIRIGGDDVAGKRPFQRNVNTVFQHYALFPHMTVGENVAYGLRQKGVTGAELGRRVGEALEVVRLTGLASRFPAQLSGGQQQRVALARALVNRPAVLLLDEPLGALDRKLRQAMQVELKLLQSALGTTFIYVTHDQEEALSMSDRLAVMHEGTIQQVGTPDDVYETPANALVAGFVGLQNFLPGRCGSDSRHLEADGVTVRAARTVGEWRAGQAAVAAVRPESITLSRVPPREAVNTVEGTVVSVLHLGDTIQVVVRTRAGELIARHPRLVAERLPVGAPVWCGWEVDHAQLFVTERGEQRAAESAQLAFRAASWQVSPA